MHIQNVGSWLVSGNYHFRIITTLTDHCGSLCLSCSCLNQYKTVYAEHLLSLWESRMSVQAVQKLPPCLGTDHLHCCPGGPHFPVLSQHTARIGLCDSTGRGLWEPASSFPQTLPHAPFPSAYLILHPFTAMNLNHEYGYMLCPGRPLANH